MKTEEETNGESRFKSTDCPLCGYSTQYARIVPPEEVIAKARALREEVFYELVSEEGQRIINADFDNEEEALQFAENLGCKVRTWMIKDSDRVPISPKVICACGEEKYVFETDEVVIPGGDEPKVYAVCVRCPKKVKR